MLVKTKIQFDGFFKKRKKLTKLMGVMRRYTKLNIVDMRLLRELGGSAIFICDTNNRNKENIIHIIQVDNHFRMIKTGKKAKSLQRENFFEISVLDTFKGQNVKYYV